MPIPKRIWAIGIGTFCIIIGPTVFINILGDPPAVEEARRVRRAKRQAEIQAQKERQIEAYAEKVIDEQEKNSPIYGRLQGHLEETTGPAQEATAWEKLREENQRKRR